MDTDDRQFLTFFAVAAAVIGFVFYAIPEDKVVITAADEPKIVEMATERVKFAAQEDKQTAFWYARRAIISELYTQEAPSHFGPGAKISFFISAALFALIFFSLVSELIGDLKIDRYFAAKADYWKNRKTKEDKVLAELLELQRKISKIED